MKITISYLEHQLEISRDYVFSCEIENRPYFYRLVKDLSKLNEGEVLENVHVFDNNNTEITLTGKFNIIVDYFNFNFDSKKLQNSIIKYIINNMLEDSREEFNKIYKKLQKATNALLDSIDMNLETSDTFEVADLLKLLNIIPTQKETLLEEIFIYINIIKCLQSDNIILFVNLKQYLSKLEIEEIYKYATYNKVQILLIDNISTGIALKTEKKLIIV